MLYCVRSWIIGHEKTMEYLRKCLEKNSLNFPLPIIPPLPQIIYETHFRPAFYQFSPVTFLSSRREILVTNSSTFFCAILSTFLILQQFMNLVLSVGEVILDFEKVLGCEKCVVWFNPFPFGYENDRVVVVKVLSRTGIAVSYVILNKSFNAARKVYLLSEARIDTSHAQELKVLSPLLPSAQLHSPS